MIRYVRPRLWYARKEHAKLIKESAGRYKIGERLKALIFPAEDALDDEGLFKLSSAIVVLLDEPDTGKVQKRARACAKVLAMYFRR